MQPIELLEELLEREPRLELDQATDPRKVLQHLQHQTAVDISIGLVGGLPRQYVCLVTTPVPFYRALDRVWSGKDVDLQHHPHLPQLVPPDVDLLPPERDELALSLKLLQPTADVPESLLSEDLFNHVNLLYVFYLYF